MGAFAFQRKDNFAYVHLVDDGKFLHQCSPNIVCNVLRRVHLDRPTFTLPGCITQPSVVREVATYTSSAGVLIADLQFLVIRTFVMVNDRTRVWTSIQLITNELTINKL